MTYNKLPSDLKELVRHMIITHMETNDSLVSATDVLNIVAAVSVLVEYEEPTVGMKVEPAKAESDETVMQFDPSSAGSSNQDDIIDALLFAVLGNGLTQAAEDRLNVAETAVKPRWRLLEKKSGAAGTVSFFAAVDNPKHRRAVSGEVGIDYEMPDHGIPMPYEVAMQLLRMFGKPITELA